MRKRKCVPMIALCLLLSSCGGEKTTKTDLRDRYQSMSGCTMVGIVSCTQDDTVWTATLRCDYVPDGEISIEVLAPESIAGVRAVISSTDWRLEYEDMVLNAGTLSEEAISPALCLPRLMSALREGWLLEENEETWQDIPCLRLTVDQSGSSGKLLSTLWLRIDDGTPLRGELAAEDEIILTAEFTSFSFYDTINN